MANWVDHFLRFLIPDEQELYVRGCEFSFERHSTVSQHTAEQFASAWSKYTKGDLFSKFSYPYVLGSVLMKLTCPFMNQIWVPQIVFIDKFILGQGKMETSFPEDLYMLVNQLWLMKIWPFGQGSVLKFISSATLFLEGSLLNFSSPKIFVKCVGWMVPVNRHINECGRMNRRLGDRLKYVFELGNKELLGCPKIVP